jgi:hypothetical protein
LRKKKTKAANKTSKGIELLWFQVGMNERTKKNTCKTRNVLGKSRFYQNQNQIGFPANRQTKGTTQKERHSHNRISKFKMIIHLDRFFSYTNQIHVQKQFNAILSYNVEFVIYKLNIILIKQIFSPCLQNCRSDGILLFLVG